MGRLALYVALSVLPDISGRPVEPEGRLGDWTAAWVSPIVDRRKLAEPKRLLLSNREPTSAKSGTRQAANALVAMRRMKATT